MSLLYLGKIIKYLYGQVSCYELLDQLLRINRKQRLCSWSVLLKCSSDHLGYIGPSILLRA